RGGNAGSVTGYFASQEAESPVRAIPLDRGHFSRFDRARGRHAANHRSAETRRSELVEESSGRLGRAFRGRTRAGVDAHPARDALHGADRKSTRLNSSHVAISY